MTDLGLGTFMSLMTNNIYGMCNLSSVLEEELNKILLFIDWHFNIFEIKMYFITDSMS